AGGGVDPPAGSPVAPGRCVQCPVPGLRRGAVPAGDQPAHVRRAALRLPVRRRLPLLGCPRGTGDRDAGRHPPAANRAARRQGGPGGAPMSDPTLTRVSLRSGTLTLCVERAEMGLHELCGYASRRSRKRGFVFVSKVLGKHYPVRPRVMDEVYTRLASKLTDI